MRSSLYPTGGPGNIFVSKRRAPSPCRRAPPEGQATVIRILVRSTLTVAMIAVATTALAAPGAAARHAGGDRAHRAITLRARRAPAWMTAALLGAFSRPADSPAGAIATADPAGADRAQVTKPHQDPAFPAVFVFQAFSAQYLAVNTTGRPARRGPIAG